MSKYALYKGIGQAATSLADDIGERLKQERLAKYQQAQLDARTEAQKGIIGIQNKNQMARDEANFQREKELISERAKVGAGSQSRSEYGRTYDDLIRTMPGMTPEHAAEMAHSMMTQSKNPPLAKFVQDNLENAMMDGSFPRTVVDEKTGEEREITRDEAVKQLTSLYESLTNRDKKSRSDKIPTRVETEKGDPVIIQGHSIYGDVTESDVLETMRANNMTRQQVLDFLSAQKRTPEGGISGNIIRH